jgi:tetratricopeptide (TPR) repeat protein
MLGHLFALGLVMTVALAVSAQAAEPRPDFDNLWDYEHPAKTETAFRGLLPKARETGDRSYLVQLLTQLARTQGLQRRFDEAHRTLDEAEALLSDDLKTARVRYLLERGRVFNSSGQKEKARPLFLHALDAAKAAGEDGYAVDAAHMLAIVETGQAALDWNLRAMELAEGSSQPEARRWLGALYNNTGWTHFDAKEYPRALEMLRKALEFYKTNGTPLQLRIAKYSVGRVLRETGDLKEALALQEEARREMERAKEPDGYVYEELGECLLRLNRPSAARPHFAKAFALLSKDPDVKGDTARLERLKKLGSAHQSR